MNPLARAAVVGGLLALLAAAAVVIAIALGVIPTVPQTDAAERVLVICTAPDESGTELAPIAFVVDEDSGEVVVLDTLTQATVSGTSARTAREALPYGGGAAVADALAAQTDGTALDWILVPSPEWARLVDDAGGVVVTVPAGVNAYSSGSLTILAPGRKELGGAEAVALASAVPFLGGGQVQAQTASRLTAAVSAAVGSSGGELRELVAAGRAKSSLDASQVPLLGPAR